jgi:hypothetical protein
MSPTDYNTLALALTGGRYRRLASMRAIAARDTALLAAAGPATSHRHCAGGEHCTRADTHGLPPAPVPANRPVRSMFGPILTGMVPVQRKPRHLSVAR